MVRSGAVSTGEARLASAVGWVRFGRVRLGTERSGEPRRGVGAIWLGETRSGWVRFEIRKYGVPRSGEEGSGW